MNRFHLVCLNLRSRKAFQILGLSAFFALSLPSLLATAAVEHAKVNGKPITDRDLTLALGGISEGQRSQILRDPETKKQLIQNVIDQEVLFQQAEKEKYDQNQEYKDAIEAFRKQFLVNMIIEKKVGSKLTEEAGKKYFQQNKNKFSTEQVRAQHILVATEQEAKNLLNQAKAKGANFQALAEKFSKDPSAKSNRGDLGYFTRDRMVPEFAEAAFGAKKGEVIGPVKTNFGFHLIKVVDKKGGKTLEYPEVELQVKAALKQEQIRAFLEESRKTAKIETP